MTISDFKKSIKKNSEGGEEPDLDQPPRGTKRLGQFISERKLYSSEQEISFRGDIEPTDSDAHYNPEINKTIKGLRTPEDVYVLSTKAQQNEMIISKILNNIKLDSRNFVKHTPNLLNLASKILKDPQAEVQEQPEEKQAAKLPEQLGDILSSLKREKIELADSIVLDLIKTSRNPTLQKDFNLKQQSRRIGENKTLSEFLKTVRNHYFSLPDKYIKFNHDSRKRAAKDRVEVNKISEWLENNCSGLMIEYEDLMRNRLKLTTEKRIVYEEELWADLKQQLGNFDSKFSNFFYKYHSYVSYAYFELRNNLQSSCKARGSLLAQIYQKMVELMNIQNSFVSDYIKQTEYIQAMQLAQLEHQHQFEMKEAKIKLESYHNWLIEEKKKNQLNLEKIDSLRSRIGNSHYSIRRLKSQMFELNQKYGLIESEKETINEILFEILLIISKQETPPDVKNKFDELKGMWDYYKKEIRRLDYESKSSNKLEKTKFYESYNLEM